jgi:hypothetical protein
MLRRVLAEADSLRLRVPDFHILQHSDIPPQLSVKEVQEWAALMRTDLLLRTSALPSDRIFVRAQPLDEGAYTKLSFAGVYQSYSPLRRKAREQNLIDGVVKVLLGRYSDYSNYYYSRHEILSSRPVDLMFSSMVEDTALFGTAYVYHDKCLLEYFDTPLSIFLQDPARICAHRNSALSGFEAKLVGTMFGVAAVLDVPVDIEFLANRKEEIFVSQVRPIAQSHLRNWERVASATWRQALDTTPPSNVINSVGTIEGKVVDLREREPNLRDFDEVRGRIYVVSHLDALRGTTSLALLQFIARHSLDGLALLVDHGKARRNDHLQYIMFEDPGISFLVNAVNAPREIDGRRLSLTSDGFTALVR